MKERGMIFNSEMVRAILDGRKTQTRRIIKSPAKNMQATGQKVIDYREPGDKWYGEHVFSMRTQSGTWCDYTQEQFLAKCPFGAKGDRLWVRESTAEDCAGSVSFARYSADNAMVREKGNCLATWWYSRPKCPSIHMPRWASRITLEITDIRVERLTSISEKDALAEGIENFTCPCCNGDPDYSTTQFDPVTLGAVDEIPCHACDSNRHKFFTLWDSIYGEYEHCFDKWVWVIEFKRV